MRLVILISGSGSTMVAIAQAIKNQKLKAHIACVISDQPDARGLNKAQDLGVETQIIAGAPKLSREALGDRLEALVSPYRPDFVVLAGFMRIIEGRFIEHNQGKLVNIHPSLLPDYKGLHTHKRVLEHKKTYHGSSVHFVNQTLDGGPVIAQVKLEISALMSGTDALTFDQKIRWLQEQVKQREQRLYPLCLHWLQTGKIKYKHPGVEPDTIRLDDHSLNQYWEDL